MMNYLFYMTALGFLYESISWLIRIRKSVAWLKSRRLLVAHTDGQKIHILLPVLEEATILRATVDYFVSTFVEKNHNTSLILITTERERASDDTPYNTIHIAAEIVQNKERVMHIHYPGRDGKMAHQLNYAVKILSDCGIVGGNDLFAVYNADSRPEPETFDWVRLKCQTSNISVFQQYGCYLGNFASIQKSLFSNVLLSAALWQTRWSIGFEIYNALKQANFTKEARTLLYPLNYCVGHGLFITKMMLEKANGFNESAHNEDAFLGLSLSFMQEMIAPIPYFDVSESPDTLGVLFRQKANWYFGPLQAYAYMRELLPSVGSLYEKVRLFVLSTRLFSHAVFWIVGPTLFVPFLIFAFGTKSIWSILLATAVVASFALPSLTSLIFFDDIRTGLKVNLIRIARKLAVGFPMFYFMHGASAYYGLYKYLVQGISGKRAVKEKTVIMRRVSYTNKCSGDY